MTTVPSISRLPKTIERTFYPSTKITVKGNEKNLQAYVITHLNTRKFEYKLFSIFQRKKERKKRQGKKQTISINNNNNNKKVTYLKV